MTLDEQLNNELDNELGKELNTELNTELAGDVGFEDMLEYHEEERPKLFFNSAVDFSLYIENRARTDGDSLIETLIAFCDEYNIDVTRIKNLISKSLYDKLKNEFVERGMIQEGETLDSFLQ